MSRAMAAELSPLGIRINVVAPGPIKTPISERLQLPPEQRETVKQKLSSMVPLGRHGDAEESGQGGSIPSVRRFVLCERFGDRRRRRCYRSLIWRAGLSVGVRTQGSRLNIQHSPACLTYFARRLSPSSRI